MYPGQKQLQQMAHLCEILSLSAVLTLPVLVVLALLYCLQKDDFYILFGFSECYVQRHWFASNFIY